MEPRIYIADIRDAGYCVKGAKKWFALHNLDWREFMKHGIPESELIAAGDALARKVIDAKRVRNGR
jgi:hypothetical protein